MNYRVSNLKQLEAESIHIIREVVAEFEGDALTEENLIDAVSHHRQDVAAE